METSPVNTVKLRTILSESRRILKDNLSHLFALALFFLPLSFSLVITPSLHLHLSDNFFHTNNQKLVILHLLYTLIVYILTLFAIGTISYSTYSVLIGKPVNYIASLKSLTFTFIPLVGVTVMLAFLLSLTFLLFVGVTVMLAKSLGFIINHE